MLRLVGKLACLVLALAFPLLSVNAADIEHMTLDDGSDVIMINGEIKVGDDEKFRKFTLAYPSGIVALESIGGLLAPSLEIGKMIRLRGYSTFILGGSTCVSTCALIWLAGSPRVAVKGARIGFHAAYLMNDSVPMETGVGNALVGSYLNLLNLPDRAVIFATSAPPTSFKWLDLENLGPSGIDVKVMEPHRANTTVTNSGAPVVPSPPPIRRMPSTVPIITKSELRAALVTTLNDPKVAKAAAQTVGLGQQDELSLINYMRALYADARYVDRLTERLYARRSEFTDGPGARQMGREVAEKLVTELQLSGVPLLDDLSIKDYFYFIDAISRYSSPTECKAIFSDDGASDHNLEMKIVARIGSGAFASWLRLQAKAVNAGLAGFTGPIISISQASAAEKAYMEALQHEYALLPKDELARVSAALDAPDKSDPVDICRSYQIVFSVAYRMPGDKGNWYRRKFLASLSEPTK